MDTKRYLREVEASREEDRGGEKGRLCLLTIQAYNFFVTKVLVSERRCLTIEIVAESISIEHGIAVLS